MTQRITPNRGFNVLTATERAARHRAMVQEQFNKLRRKPDDDGGSIAVEGAPQKPLAPAGKAEEVEAA